MTLYLNGDPAPVQPPVTIAELLNAISAPDNGIAVAVDGTVIPRGAWPTHPLADGDKVEVVTAVQGG